MSDSLSWEHGNEEYLAAALAWLRLRLEQRAQRGTAPPPRPQQLAAPLAEAPGAGWRLFRLGAPAEAKVEEPVPVIALPAAGQTAITDEEVARAAASMAAAGAIDPPPALVILAQRFGLNRFEQELLLLCAAMELDTRIPALCARAQGDDRLAYPTFALALSLFDDPTWEPLSPERPLRYFSLVEVFQPAGMPLTGSVLRADERVVSYLKGVTYLDDRLAPLLVPLSAPGSDPPASHIELV